MPPLGFALRGKEGEGAPRSAFEQYDGWGELIESQDEVFPVPYKQDAVETLKRLLFFW